MRLHFSPLWIVLVFSSTFYVNGQDTGYQAWKAEQQEQWQKKDKTSLQDQIIELIDEANYWLEDIKQDPKQSEYSEQQALYSYNYARELLGATSVTEWQDIDKSWLDEQAYKAWKEHQQESWDKDDITSLDLKVDLLINYIDLYLEDPEEIYYQTTALYAYNFIRELLKQEPVQSFKDINMQWVYQQGYAIWLKEAMESWKIEHVTELDHKIDWLANTIDSYLADIKQGYISPQRDILYAYNFLQQLLKQPPVQSFKDIDQTWLDNFGNRIKNSTHFLLLLQQNKVEEALQILRQTNGLIINVNIVSGDNWTPLLWIAATTGIDEATRLQLAEELLSRSANVHAKRNGLAVLSFASGIGGTSAALVELLIAHGANEFYQALEKARNWIDRYKNNPEHSKIITILTNKV